MSLEQAIADLQTQAGLLLDLPQQIASQAQAQIQAVAATYNAYLANALPNLFVDPVGGGDTNSGTNASPLKTLAKAVELIPPGGYGTVWLMADYEIANDMTITNRAVVVKGYGGVKRRLTFQRLTMPINTVDYFNVRGFNMRGNSFLGLRDLAIVMPRKDGAFANDLNNVLSSPIRTPTADAGPLFVGAVYCDVERAADATAPLLYSYLTTQLGATAIAETGQSMAGYWLNGVAAGATTASLSHVSSNLTTL